MGKSSKRDLATAEASTVEPVVAAAATEADDSMQVDEPKVKKSKKSKTVEGGDAVEEGSKEVPKEAISAIAKPLAGKKVSKSVLKLVKKGEHFSPTALQDTRGHRMVL